MPSIDWIGKAAVERHHLEVPYRLVHCDVKLSAGDVAAGNLLVQGDNLEALRALLPYYAGQIKCVYIDPPYNTGNEGWAYNDRVNSPQIQRWLGQVVGGEAEDLSRHDKWLCMMYPRLRLLRDFLRDDGVVFVSIDDNEVHRLRMLMDEIFGSDKTEIIIWRKSDDGRYGKMKNTNTVRSDHEYVIAGFKSKQELNKIKRLPYFSTPPRKEEGGRKWWTGYIARGERGSNESHANYYTVTAPNGKKFTAQFEESKEEFARLNENGYVHWAESGVPYRKIYTDELRLTVSSSVLLDVGTSFQGKIDLTEIFGVDGKFDNPKPVNLIFRLVELATANCPDAIVLDSFAGSGTTAEAVLKLNARDKGNRVFILVEMEKSVSENITAKRVQTVINGYKIVAKKIKKIIQGYTGKDKTIHPLGGGFRFCTLGLPLFDANGNIGKTVKFGDLAAHIFFSETGKPIPKRPRKALIGEDEGRAIYLLYNGIMGDKRRDSGNMLTSKTLAKLPKPSVADMQRVVFAEGTLLSAERLAREKVDFRQIPYKIRVR